MSADAQSDLSSPRLDGQAAARFSHGARHERADITLNAVGKFLRRLTVRFNANGMAGGVEGLEGDVASIIAARDLPPSQPIELPPPVGALPKGPARLDYFMAADRASRAVLGLTPHRSQLRGALSLIDELFIEMDTGEGKSLVAALAAAVAALSGVPTHIVTVNDYLAERDADHFGAFFASLGLQVAWVGGEMEPPERMAAYQADIVYAANKELAFDYLRDKVALKGGTDALHQSLRRFVGGKSGADGALKMQRGLYFAIVDEADSVLIDEARVPLILSATVPGSNKRPHYEAARHVAHGLTEGEDYKLDLPNRQVQLLQEAEQKIARLAQGTVLYRGARRRHMLVVQALAARHLFLCDRDYMIRDDEIVLIDENTGRAMPDRAWDTDLQASIEVKENLDLSDGRRTLAQISFQRFFRRYLHLAGLTGTAQEVAGECLAIYRRKIRRIEPNTPNQRQILPPLVCDTQAEKMQAIVAEVRSMISAGRPVLIGTRTVDVSEHVAAILTSEHIEALVLNARQDEQEAEIIAKAGLPGRVTIATNMAGRGTDIGLSDQARAAGGLHVILTEFHDAGRIDRQLIGRSARQGDPGSARNIVALDDDLLRRYTPRLLPALSHRVLSHERAPAWIRQRGFWWAQRKAESLHGQARLAMLEMDEQLDSVLAVAGKDV